MKGINDIKNMRKINTEQQNTGFRKIHFKNNLESQQKGGERGKKSKKKRKEFDLRDTNTKDLVAEERQKVQEEINI